MTENAPKGLKGYAEQAAVLLPRWAKLDVETTYAPILPFLSGAPGRALDIGAGAGNMAAYLAARGWSVTATEPVAPLRDGAMRLHADADIEWLSDALPFLSPLGAKPEAFDLVLCLAVLMHLDAGQQRDAIVKLARLLSAGGQLALSLRHGPTPPGRVMHRVSTLQCIKTAEAAGLDCCFLEAHGSVQASNKAAGVTWTWLVFGKADV